MPERIVKSSIDFCCPSKRSKLRQTTPHVALTGGWAYRSPPFRGAGRVDGDGEKKDGEIGQGYRQGGGRGAERD